MTSLLDLVAAADNGANNEEPPHGAAARSIRESAGASPTSVAAAIGIAERTLLGYERGDRQLRGAAVRLRLGRVLHHLSEGGAK